MKSKEIAALLDGCDRRDEMENWPSEASDNFVAVYGVSDDGVTFSGAINGGVGCYDGGDVFLTKEGRIINPDNDELNEAIELVNEELGLEISIDGNKVSAIWDTGKPECSWKYETEIPHSTFRVMEEDELYCIGLVFDKRDLK